MPDHDHLTHGQSPLCGVVLCCTAITAELRSEMAAIAHQMGAIHKLDLTSDVTHLIVGSIDTPKYKYVAKERQDIKVLQPAWLEAIRASWIQGEETDVVVLEDQFKLPTFHGLQICVTGFEDPVQRNDIQAIATELGATYQGDLTKSATHLIAAAPIGKKYEYAGTWGMKVVSLEWFHDSIERGMSLDESLYHPLLPLDDRGKGAVTQKKIPAPLLGKRSREQFQPAEPGSGSRRKLRRTASTRIESQNDDLWADIGSRDAEQNLAPITDPGKTTAANRDALEANGNQRSSVEAGDNLGGERSTEPSLIQRTTEAGILSDESGPLRVFIHGFDDRKKQLLHSYLSDNGAEVLSELDGNESKDATKIVVPHGSKISLVDELFEGTLVHYNVTVVTEWWVEKCLYKKRLVSHDEPLCQPFATFPIPGFEKLTICPTSFAGIDLLVFSKAVKLMGALYDETLRKETSVLVCCEASGNPGKLRYALENKIPIVSAEWLYESIRMGLRQTFEDYSLSTTRQSQKSSQGCFFHPIHNPRPHDSSKYKTGRSGVRAPQQRGCLDMIRDPKPDTREDDRRRSTTNEYSTNIPDEPTLPLQNQSPSKQNEQQGESSIYPDIETQQSAAEQEQPPGAHSTSEPKQNSLFGFDSLRVSQEDNTPQNSESANPQQEPSASSLLTAPSADLEEQHATTLNNAIATLQQKTASLHSRPSSALSDPSGPAALPPRHHRTLGRAPSNGSAALSRTTSLDRRGPGPGPGPATSSGAAPNQPPTASEPPLLADDELLDTGISARSKLLDDVAERGGFRPSQALSYEDPEGAAVREKLMQRLNRAETDADADSFGYDGLDEGVGKARGQRVESIGVVKEGAAGELKRRRGMRRK